MKIWRKFLQNLLDDNERELGFLFGLLFGIAALVVICITIFRGGIIGGVDYGEYNNVLQEVGLERTEADLANESRRYYVDVSDTFDYTAFPYETLLVHSKYTLVYPVVIVRLLTKIFGLPFYTEVLAVVYALLLAFPMFLMSKTLYRRYGTFAIKPCILGLLILCVPNLVGYLNSLHWQGTAFVGMYGSVCVFIWAALSPLRGRLMRFVVLCLYGMLLCGSNITMLVFLPLSFLSALWILLRDRPEKTRLAVYYFLGGLFMLWCTQYSIRAVISSPDYVSPMSRYQAAFNGSIQYADNKSKALASYGLEDSYLSDIGLNFYETGDKFTHDPKQSAEWSVLDDKLTMSKTLSLYFKNPDAMTALLQEKASSLHTIQNGRIAVKGTGSRQTITNYLNLVGELLPLSDQFTFLIVAGITAVLSIVFLIFKKERSRFIPLGFLLLTLLVVSAYLPWAAIVGGTPMIDIAKPIFGAAWLILIAGLCTCAMYVVSYLNTSENEDSSSAAAIEDPVMLPRRKPTWIGRALLYLIGNRKYIVIINLTLSFAMLFVLLFIAPRAGGINNGDYGRMMKELDITWTEQLNTNTDFQAGKSIIEEYNYSTNLKPLKLTALDPSYSLVYPAALVRIYSAVTGNPFNTRIIQYIFCLITVLCILSIVYDLYPIMGVSTVIPAVLLPMMCFGENYIAWYNSLYGESSISVGLLMTLAACVHLAVRERGKKILGWLIFLGFALKFLTCAKAQMLVTLPVACGLLIFFFIYHRPKVASVFYKILYILISLALIADVSLTSIGVYRDNDKVSSRQTVWQSVFFGALMISDDVDAAMKELGIAPEMKADIGKHAYYPDEDYVYAPMSEEANAAFYDHVNTFTMVRYYLRHPKDLIYMLNYGASQSVKLHTGFMAYEGQRYDLEHKEVSRFSLWSQLRTALAPNGFWQYVLLYGAMLVLMVGILFRKKISSREKALVVVWMAIMAVGALEFPLTVVGNGFADNNKQLYAFMLCHDLLILTLATYLMYIFIRMNGSGK